ncbi:MAG: 1,4-alpha-glucan branching protein GlgB [Saprospiraceae bacterium]|nr:1,4-alpha-glucan branching protein GlgB [Saprospiraceae bacterium]
MKSFSLFTDFDIYLFKSGKLFRAYEKLGSHIVKNDEGTEGVFFAVWAPNARQVSVIGSFNYWNKTTHIAQSRWDGSGIWEVFIPEAQKGDIYKYCIWTNDGRLLEKTDPYAFMWETPPQTASIVWDLDFEWHDSEWQEKQLAKAGKPQPMTVYEVHAGSWKRNSYEGNRSLTYREMAEHLVPYVAEMGFTHIEFMPIMEHPYEPSWGYQTLGYFAPSSRFGTPQDFMHLVEAFHKAGVGVILDWVPSHFPMDAHGLYDFDGTHLYEHADPRLGYHPDWKSAIYNYNRNEVRCFLISSALFWMDKFHADGLRVDAVASMLYLDYSRKEGEWIPNHFGGRENLEAIAFLKEFNETVFTNYPAAVTIAEESTAFPMVSRPTWMGGLGFSQKWMMGWMHDTLNFFKRPPIYRKWHQNEITFSIVYGFSENFMLPLSHDEVVYGKGSLLTRMPGDEWQQFANLRLMFGYMFTHPGTRLVFMGGEFGQGGEWAFERQLDWWLLDSPNHKGIQTLMKDLNGLNKSEPAIYERAFDSDGFAWVSYDDTQNSVIAYLRKANDDSQDILVVCNMTPQVVNSYELGVPKGGKWVELLNTDATQYGGSNVLNEGTLKTKKGEKHGHTQYLNVTLAPLATMVFKCREVEKPKKMSKKTTV